MAKSKKPRKNGYRSRRLQNAVVWQKINWHQWIIPPFAMIVALTLAFRVLLTEPVQHREIGMYWYILGALFLLSCVVAFCVSISAHSKAFGQYCMVVAFTAMSANAFEGLRIEQNMVPEEAASIVGMICLMVVGLIYFVAINRTLKLKSQVACILIAAAVMLAIHLAMNYAIRSFA